MFGDPKAQFLPILFSCGLGVPRRVECPHPGWKLADHKPRQQTQSSFQACLTPHAKTRAVQYTLRTNLLQRQSLPVVCRNCVLVRSIPRAERAVYSSCKIRLALMSKTCLRRDLRSILVGTLLIEQCARVQIPSRSTLAMRARATFPHTAGAFVGFAALQQSCLRFTEGASSSFTAQGSQVMVHSY